ncbi:MAG: domain protein beta Propeller [Myxococcales bacterium]|nr:domain protein beta Propeller [Myxococcales bacterium]
MGLFEKSLVVLAAIVGLAGAARAGDPDRVYRTVETDHFVIHYWVPLDDVAARIGVAAERAHRILSPALDHVPAEKTLIFIADDTDSANGFAGVLPRNAITLYATGPDSFSELDDHDDWLYGLVAHEYTHILHLDTMEGLPNIYNSIFGKTWAPNQIMPRWIIEGIAVYEESKRSAGGRNRGTRFDQFIRIARHDNKELRIDQISGSPRQFPRGNAAYIYGSHFLSYVFDRFGDDTVRKMAHVAGSWAPPFAINRQIAKVVGKPFTELYDDWNAFIRDKYGMQEMAAERRGLATGRMLTHSAETNVLAHYSADGKDIFWLAYDGYSLPRVRAMPVGGDVSSARDIAQIDSMGPFDLLPDNSLVYEQGRQYRRDYSFQDLFRWDARTGQTVRLTTGRRARNPAVSPDGRRVAFSKNEHSESVLAVMDVAPDAPDTVVWRGQRYDQAYQPAWSPDGKRIAFSAWRRGGFRDILIVDVGSGAVEEITHDRAIDMSPAWSSDGRYVYFDSDRSTISNVYAYDTTDHTTWQITNVLGGAFQAEPSPDGKRLVYESAVPDGGYDLYEVALDRSTWLPAREYVDDKPPPIDIKDDEVAVSKPRPFRSIETLAPQSWTATVDLATHTAAIQTGGQDDAGLHGYALAIGLDLDTGDTNLGASYGYSGFRPTFRVSGARTLLQRSGWRVDGVNMRYREEDWSGTVALGIPLESRPGTSWSLSFDYDVDWFRLVQPPPITEDPNQRVPLMPPSDYVQAGVGSRLGFSTVRGTTFSVGPTNGFDASVSLRLDNPALGATYHNVTVSYASDVFLKLWGRTPAMTLRLVGALRTGDLVRNGSFGLGGIPAQDVVMSIVNSTRSSSIGYLRGYPGRSLVGNQYHLLNFEYRQELWQIEHGLATLPVYVRRMHIAALSDAATAFDQTFDASKNLRWSVGAALRVDAFFGYFVPGTFEIGYARGLIQGGVGQTWFLLTGSL